MGILYMNEIECLKKVCICLFFIIMFLKERSMDILEKQEMEEREPELEVEEDIIISYDR